MFIKSLNHVNIHTRDLERLGRFYENTLGLPKGERPPFASVGIWHYCNDLPVVHLIEDAESPTLVKQSIDHFAFFGEDLAEFLAHLRAQDVDYSLVTIPEVGNWQVNVRDPDGNRVEIQFAAHERPE